MASKIDDVKLAIKALSATEAEEILAEITKTHTTKIDLPSFPGEEDDRADCRLGRILVGRNTLQHESRLTKLGFKVTVEDGTIENRKEGGRIDQVKYLFVDCEGFVDAVHINDLQKTADEKRLIHYRTMVDFGNNIVLSGIAACQKLGPWSCLMASPINDLIQDR